MQNRWLLASRPKTLPAAAVPVVIGTVMAYTAGAVHWVAAALALTASLLIQVGTNFVNDYADFERGTDTGERIGPLRVSQAGLVTAKEMKTAIGLVFAAAVAVSGYLVYCGGWPILLIGVLAILSGILYTAGPFPLGYLGLGDIFVLVFFGPVAVGGTYYVQTLTIDGIVLLAGLAPGFISVAILAVNNLRDVEGDRLSGKKTLAVRFGKTFARMEYFYSLLLACVIPPAAAYLSVGGAWAALGGLTFFFTPGVLMTVFALADGPSLNGALASTGKLLVIYGVLFSLGWLLAG